MKRLERAQLPTKYGDFNIYAFGGQDEDLMPHIALVTKDLSTSDIANVRIHSECMTGDVFK
ncbi:MAG: GTP cyclohydrolase II, partial [Bacteroidia bacterium]|nr:GTP cyclohydrolase II [Bacteroidia bacterium]